MEKKRKKKKKKKRRRRRKNAYRILVGKPEGETARKTKT
jgi:hypothetical protein